MNAKASCQCCGAFELESRGAQSGLCDACKRRRPQAAYQVERTQRIAQLDRVMGSDKTVPLSDVASLLPDNPEWTEYAPRRIRKRRGGKP